jgi:hypothetical protein
MAISIPIIAEFDGKAISRAKREFQQLEGVGKKTAFAIRKAAIPAAAALAGIGTALFDATKGAIEDAAAQQLLAKNLKRTTKATDVQIAAVEDWITEQGKLLGITDDELRPALAKLAKATSSVTKAQKLVAQAMDISAATGKPLETVVNALEKAYGGNLQALSRLAPEYRQMIKDGATFEEVMDKLSKTTGGAAADAADTAQGKFKRLKVSLDETKEAIGEALLPVVEKALPYLQRFADWASENPDEFMIIAGAISAIAAAITLVNIAMALNPFTLIAIGVIAIVAAIGIAYKKFDGFAEFVRKTINRLSGMFEMLVNAFIKMINGLIFAYNLLPFVDDIAPIPFVDIPTMKAPETPGQAWRPGPGQSANPTAMAEGGIVTGPTFALIGEGGESEAVIPLSKLAQMGYGGSGVNITVQTGVGDPVAIGREVAKVMDAYSRRSGVR